MPDPQAKPNANANVFYADIRVRVLGLDDQQVQRVIRKMAETLFMGSVQTGHDGDGDATVHRVISVGVSPARDGDSNTALEAFQNNKLVLGG